MKVTVMPVITFFDSISKRLELEKATASPILFFPIEQHRGQALGGSVQTLRMVSLLRKPRTKGLKETRICLTKICLFGYFELKAIKKQ